MGPREQINGRTHWLDLDHVYGSTENDNAALIDQATGKFLVSKGPKNEDILPLASDKCSYATRNKCHLAGDSRAEDNSMLTSFHTLYVRAHNILIDLLPVLRPEVTEGPEKFQEARKILIAIHQNIVYGEFLPTLLGDKLARAYGLLPLAKGFFDHYDSHRYPQVANEFATAAFRYGIFYFFIASI